MKEKTVTIKEAAFLLGVTPQSICRLRDQGKLTIYPPVQARVLVSDIERLQKERGTNADIC